MKKLDRFTDDARIYRTITQKYDSETYQILTQ